MRLISCRMRRERLYPPQAYFPWYLIMLGNLVNGFRALFRLADWRDGACCKPKSHTALETHLRCPRQLVSINGFHFLKNSERSVWATQEAHKQHQRSQQRYR